MDAALEIIASDGLAKLTMREAARRSGVSSGAPYRHFADVAALLSALAAEANELLERTTASAIAAANDDPLSRFRATGVAFVVFAAEHPLHFRLMCDPALAPATDDADTAAITESIEAGLIGGDAADIALAARAAVYGLAHMIADGHFGEVDGERARELAMTVTGVLGSGFVNH